MAIDIDQSHYATGSAAVAGTAVTGIGTTWLGAVRKGDMYGTHRGAGVRIASVNSDTSITLAYAVTALNQASGPYEIQRTPYDVGYLKAIEDMIRLYGVGNLPSFAELDGTGGGKYPRFTGVGALDVRTAAQMLADLSAVAKAGDTMSGDLAVAKGNPRFSLNKSSGGNAISALSAGLQRWLLQLGDASAETGSNAGSDLYIGRYNDAGTLIDQALSIIRSTGIVSLAKGLFVGGGQIRFPNTQVPSTDPFTLDDYREGTTNPTVTAASGTLTSAGCTLTYVKIGKWVWINAEIGINNNGTGAAFLFLPLPFTGAGTAAFYGHNNANAAALSARLSGSSVLIFTYAGAYPVVTGNVINVSGCYMAA